MSPSGGDSSGGGARDTAFAFPVEEDTRALARELETLGGGKDVAMGVAHVFVSVCPAPARAAGLRERGGEGLPQKTVVRAIHDTNTQHRTVVLEVDDPDRPSTSFHEGRTRGGEASENVTPHPPRNQLRTRKYKLDGVSATGRAPEDMWRAVTSWMHRGFDATVVAHGQAGVGKTRCLFGDGGGAFENDRPGLVSKVARALFARLEKEQAEALSARAARRFTERSDNVEKAKEQDGPFVLSSDSQDSREKVVAVSAWELLPNGDLVDLFDRGGGGSGGFGGNGDRFDDFERGRRMGRSQDCLGVRRIWVKNASEVEAALALTRRVSKNWRVPTRQHGNRATEGFAGTAAVPVPNIAHAFFRLTVVDQKNNVVNELHVVDLIGAKSMGSSGGAESSANRGSTVTRSKEKRDVATSLLAFTRVVDEIASGNAGADAGWDDSVDAEADRGPSTSARVPSANDSKLTQILAPLLNAGTKTFFLACISPLDVDYIDTLETMRVASRVGKINTACVRRRLAPEQLRDLFGNKRMGTLREVLAERASFSGGVRVAKHGDSIPTVATVAVGTESTVAHSTQKTGDCVVTETSHPRTLSPNRPARFPEGLTTRSQSLNKNSDAKSKQKIETYLTRTEPAALRLLTSNSLRDFESDAPGAFQPRVAGTAPFEEHALTGDELSKETLSKEDEAVSKDDDAAWTNTSRVPFGDWSPSSNETTVPTSPATALDSKLKSLRLEFEVLYRNATGATDTEDEPAKEKNHAYDEYFTVDQVDYAPAAPTTCNSASPELINRDDETFETVFDDSLGTHELRRRLNASLATLMHEKGENVMLTEKLRTIERNCSEAILTAQANEESARLELAELRRRVGLLQENTTGGYHELFMRYEKDIADLNNEVTRLREDNVSAVLGLSEFDTRDENINPHFGGGDSTGKTLDGKAIGAEAGLAVVLANRDVQKRLDRLCRALRKSEEARLKVEAEKVDLKKRERAVLAKQRGFESQLKRLHGLEAKNESISEATRTAHLQAARADALRLEAEAELLQTRRDLLEEEERADRAEADRHRTEARCHELEAAVLERRAASVFPSAARNASLDAARSVLDVPNQPSLLKAAAELRAAAQRAVSDGDGSAVNDLFDLFVLEIEAGFSTKGKRRDVDSGDSRVKKQGTDEPCVSSSKTPSETPSSRVAEKSDSPKVPSEPPKRSRSPQRRSTDQSGVPPRSWSRSPTPVRPTSVGETNTKTSNASSDSDGGWSAQMRSASKGIERSPYAPLGDPAPSDPPDFDPEPVFGYGGPTASSNGVGVAERFAKQKRVTVANKRLSLRAPPADIAAAAAAAAAARRVLKPRAPFATDESYDFLFDKSVWIDGAGVDAHLKGEPDGKNRVRFADSRYVPPFLVTPPGSPKRDKQFGARSDMYHGPPKKSRDGGINDAHSPTRRRQTDANSPPELRSTSSICGLTRFNVGRSPSPSPPRERALGVSPPSPSSLARSPPGSPRRFYPAGRPSVYVYDR